MFEHVCKIIKTVISAMVGVFLLNYFNIFNYISVIPVDKAFDVGVIVYFTVIELILNIVIHIYYKYCISKLSVVISLNNNEATKDSIPIIEFNKKGLAEAIVKVEIEGRKKHFLNWNLMLASTKFATMQSNSQKNVAYVDQEGNYIISIKDLFGTSDTKTVMSVSFRITFIKEWQNDGDVTTTIIPELKNKNSKRWYQHIIYKHNKAKLELER